MMQFVSTVALKNLRNEGKEKEYKVKRSTRSNAGPPYLYTTVTPSTIRKQCVCSQSRYK